MILSSAAPGNTSVPTAAIMKALVFDPAPRKQRSVSPKKMIDTYSVEVNSRANFARGGATNMSPMMLKVPAIKDPKAAIPRAGPARPWRAIL